MTLQVIGTKYAEFQAAHVCCFERRPAVGDVSCGLVRKPTAVEIIFLLFVCFSANVAPTAGIHYSLLFAARQ